MQISTRVVTTTQIVLNQDELKEAVIDYVKAKTETPADAKFEVDFADDARGDLEAVVNIAGTSASGTEPKKPSEAPRTAGTKPKVVTPPASKPAAEPVVETEKPNISENPENRENPADKPDEPPFEVDPPTVEETITVADPPKPAVAAAAPKIFPQTGTSAPTPPKAEEEVDPAVKAKSLFANLTKPAN